MRVIRLLLAFLSALALALSPIAEASAAAASAAAAPAAMADCEMHGDMPADLADQSKMACCGPACPAPAPAAVQPDGNSSATVPSRQGLHATALAKALYSLAPTGLDPPPRLLS
jgi:hypothetical protein